MPSSRRDAGFGHDSSAARTEGQRDEYMLDDDDGEDGTERSGLPAAMAGKPVGLTLGKRAAGAVLGGSEAKQQAKVTSLFANAHKKQQAVRRVPAGMVNLGNTCYLNSVVQVLLNMPAFVADLRHPALKTLRDHLPPSGIWAALCATLTKLVTATASRPNFDNLKPAVEPSELRAAMGRRNGRWRSFAQQDAHEFLVELLEGLQSEVLAAEGAATGRRRLRLSNTQCPTARNLGGCLVHTWTCSGCGRCTRAKELFNCLSLQLPQQGSVKLQDLVAEYLKEESIDKNCDGCSPSAPVAHTVQHHFWRLPRVLVVHIKRFMPIMQRQQPAPPQQQPGQGQGSNGSDGEGQVAASAMLAADDSDNTAQPVPRSAPGTPHREDTAQRPQTTAVVGANGNGNAAGSTGAAVGGSTSDPASRDTSPPAPYLYAKLHTVVQVAPALDLARHCDAAARAHKHLLEGVQAAALARRSPEDGAAACLSAAATHPRPDGIDGNGTAAGAADADAARTPGPAAACTLDTVGGGSTCPSPSFLQPNASALQEHSVQQHLGCPPHTHPPHPRSRLGLTPRARAGQATGKVLKSECGTSAISTGAQADAGGEAPTPHGGEAPGGSPKRRRQEQELARKQQQQQYQQRLHDQDRPLATVGKGKGGLAALERPAGLGVVGRALGLNLNTAAALAAALTPQAQLRPAVTGLANGGGVQATPAARPTGVSRQSNLPGSARLPPEPNNVCRDYSGGAVCGGAATGPAAAAGESVGAAACLERKAPKPVAAGSFFGGTGTEAPRSGQQGCGGGGRVGPGDGKDVGLFRSSKRLCVDGPPVPASSRHAAEAAPPGSSGPALGQRRVEDMTEDEQLQLALQMSLAEDLGAAAGACGGGSSIGPGSGHQRQQAGAATGAGTAGEAGSGPLGGTSTVLDLSVPTTAARHGSSLAAGAVTQPQPCRRASSSGDSAMVVGDGCGDAATVVKGRGRGGVGGAEAALGSGGVLDEEPVIELQDESPGGVGAGRRDRGCRRGAGSDPAASGASGGRGESGGGDESDCSGGGYPGKGARPLNRRQAARLGRRLNRNLAACTGDCIPDFAESPALPPPQRRRLDTSGGGRDRNNAIAHYLNYEEDDGTTALSPSSGAPQLPVGPTGAGVVGGGPQVTSGGVTSAGNGVDMVPADEEDAEMAEVLKMSMETFAAEEAERQRREGGVGGAGAGAGRTAYRDNLGAGFAVAKSREDERWQQVLALPDADTGCDDAAAAGATLNTSCRAPLHPGGGSKARDDDGIIAPPPPSPVRRCTVTAGGEGSGRGSGMDALVAAAGLDAGRDDTGGAEPAASGGGGTPDVAAAAATTTSGDPSQFKFGFSLPGNGGGGDGVGPAGGRREEPLDLTGDGPGGDDDDVELNKAIMLSLQEDGARRRASAFDVEDDPMDFNGLEAADVNDAEPVAPPKPKVHLLADSECGEEDDHEVDAVDEGDSGGGSGSGAGTLPGTDKAAGAHSDQQQRQWQKQQPKANAAGPSAAEGGGVDGGVPLAQMARYRLRGVVRHKGFTPFSGHYVADALVATANGQLWYEHNDAVVSHVDFARVREDAEKQGYMFFFVNESPRETVSPADVAAAAAMPLPD